MSIFSKWREKAGPPPDTPEAGDAGVPVEPAAPADPEAQAREEQAALEQALAVGDMAEVGRWALEGHSTRLRQAAAQAISDPDQLHALILATRHGKDKQVYRILTKKHDALLATARREEQLQAEIRAAAAAIAECAAREAAASSASTLAQLEARWSAVAAQATPELHNEVTAQLAAARRALEQHLEEQAAEQARQRAEADAAEAARRQRAAEAEAAAAIAAEEARRLEAEREAERQAEVAKRKAEQAAAREMLSLLRQAQAALGRGTTARAERLRDAITERLPEAAGLPPWFARQFEELQSRLKELEDWKTFRVAPKRAELLQKMQALVGAQTSPEELARHIRRLREEWRSLERGAGHDDAPEAQQFEEAAERAYAPCKEHFARQAETRRENQGKREELLERLSAFAAAQAGESPDLRLINQVIGEAREEWRQYAPVDQSVVKPLQARFHALLDELRGRLAADYARNLEAKRALVARAAGLAEVEDTREAIAAAKELQRAWKTIGLVPHKEGNALWADFRRHCDAVFQRSSQEAAAQAVALEAQQGEAVALCEALERIAGLAGDELPLALQEVGELLGRFESLELPRASARELRQRFARALDRCREARRRAEAAAARQGWAELLAAAALVRACALAVAEGRDAGDCEALRASAESAVAGLANAPKGTKAILERQLAAVADGTISTDLAANESALRLLCVRAELIAGVETPAEDLELRRHYQMQRLVDAMARGERDTPGDLDRLAQEWLLVGPVAAAVHDALFARFERCRDGL